MGTEADDLDEIPLKAMARSPAETIRVNTVDLLRVLIRLRDRERQVDELQGRMTKMVEEMRAIKAKAGIQ